MLGKLKRLNLIGIIGAMGVILVLAAILFSKPNPTDAASKFMDGLARGDVKTVASMTYMEKRNPAEIEKQWEYAINGAGKYYHFIWQITGSSQSSDTTSAVQMNFMRDAGKDTSYDEKYELPMILKDGKWLVDIRRVDRRLFPAMPR